MLKEFKKEKIISILIYSFFLVWLLVFLLPINPNMPTTGLDPSWRWAMNYASLNNLHFGKDIYFTFGPLADFWFPIYFYNPSTYKIAMMLSFALIIVIFISLYLTTKKLDNFSKTLGFFVLIIGLEIGKVFVWYLLPLLFAIISLNNNCKNSIFKIISILLVFFLSFSILIKFSHFPTAILSVIIIDIFYFYKYKIKIPLNTILLFFFMLLLFVIEGQKIFNFIDYLVGSFNTLLGYSEAMQNSGPQIMIIIFLIMSFSMAILLLPKIIKTKDIKELIFFIISSLLLFIGFKNGFVRHDGHAIGAFSIMSFTFGMLFLYYAPMFKNETIKFSYLSLIILTSTIVSLSITGFYSGNINFYQVLTTNFNSNKNKISEIPKLISRERIDTLDKKYISSIEKIKNQIDLSEINGTVDIYPWDQAYILANGLNYNPRPLFQSYSVYTPTLIKKNIDFLYSNKAPEYILFNIKNIDNRLPSMMEGASWLDIMSLYDIFDIKDEFLLLKKSKNNKFYKLINIEQKIISFDEEINIPKGFIFSKIDIEKTFFGSIINILFKSPIINIEFNFQDGSKERKRILPGITSSGFILSPYLDTKNKFFNFSIGKKSGKIVKSIKLINDFGYCYKDEIKIKFNRIETSNFIPTNNLLNNLKKLNFYKNLIDMNKNLDAPFFQLEKYNNKNIIFSHVGIKYRVNKDILDSLLIDNKLYFGYGIKKEAYSENNNSDGACFNIYKENNLIYTHCIDPKNNKYDRDLQQQSIVIDNKNVNYIFEVTPRNNNSSDYGWSYWQF